METNLKILNGPCQVIACPYFPFTVKASDGGVKPASLEVPCRKKGSCEQNSR